MHCIFVINTIGTNVTIVQKSVSTDHLQYQLFLCEGSQVFEKALYFLCPRICHLFIIKYVQKWYFSDVSTLNVVKEVKILSVYFFCCCFDSLFTFPTKNNLT